MYNNVYLVNIHCRTLTTKAILLIYNQFKGQLLAATIIQKICYNHRD